MNITKILVVDDSASQRTKLQLILEQNGFHVTGVEDGGAMKKAFTEAEFDIVLLDVAMPGEDGFTLVPYLREHHRVGIIMVTGSDELLDRVLGLELGADDYITKPYEPRELIARIKSVQRRLHTSIKYTPQADADTMIGFGDYLLNLQAQQLTDQEGNIIEITSMEFDLLKIFAESPDRVLSRDYLLNQAHHGESESFDRSIDIRIGRIRRKIEQNPRKPKLIKTVRGAGYMFVSANAK